MLLHVNRGSFVILRDEGEDDVKPFSENEIGPNLLNLQRTILNNNEYKLFGGKFKRKKSIYRKFNFDVPGVVDILDGVLVPCRRLEQIIFVERYYKVKM